MKDAPIYIIAAIDSAGGIGLDGTIPWRLPSELQYFRKITSQNLRGTRSALIMGRKTWESLPPKNRPLKGRFNIVISSTIELERHPDLAQARSLDEAILLAKLMPDIDTVFIIGGESVYKEALEKSDWAAIFLSLVPGDYGCDTFFPKVSARVYRVAQSEQDGWTATVYERFIEKRKGRL